MASIENPGGNPVPLSFTCTNSSSPRRLNVMCTWGGALPSACPGPLSVSTVVPGRPGLGADLASS